MEDRQLKEKAIKFKGSDYVQVKDRIQYLADNYEWQYSIETNYQYFEESKTWVVRARLTIWTSVFTWLAQEVEWQGYINKTSALENAETSAVWRAIAFAWIGVIDSIASIDEINKANNRSETPYTKPIFWEKNFEKLKAKADDYSFDEIWLKIHENYSIDSEMEHKLMDLYWKTAWDLFK